MIDNKFEFAIDDIQNLGKMVEIEYKKETQDVKEAFNEIYTLLKKIGITEFTQFDRGYICMTLNPDHNFGEKIKL